MSVTGHDSLKTRRTFKVGSKSYDYFSLEAAASAAGLGDISRLPFSMKVLLENLVRLENGRTVTVDDIKAVAAWLRDKTSEREIAFRPARVLMQDFTGVPAVVDLAAMREAMVKLGGDAKKINPLSPVDLVIDHSVMVDSFGSKSSFKDNVKHEFERNGERYSFLRWGQNAFDNFRVVPPGTGICHQVNLEYLAQVVWTTEEDGKQIAYPDTLVGTDSHTTMVNGLAVLGWGVGGIEAEAAMLGQPISMVLPEVVGFKLHGTLKEGATATDLVLTVTQMLRKKGVVGHFVEFYGPGLDALALADRATIGNMAPEYGATCGFFPIDSETLRYLTLTGRDADARQARRGLCQGAGHVARRRDARPGLHRHARARPLRPSSRRSPGRAGRRTASRSPASPSPSPPSCRSSPASPMSAKHDRHVAVKGSNYELKDGDVVIAAITSCTNTSNPSVMLAAGLARAQRREARPQGQALGQDLAGAGQPGRHRLLRRRRACRAISTRSASTSSAMAAPPASAIPGRCRSRSPRRSRRAISSSRRCSRATAISRAASIPQVRANYLASPPLVVAYAHRRLDDDRSHDGAARRRMPTASRSISRTSGRRPRRSRTPSRSR